MSPCPELLIEYNGTPSISLTHKATTLRIFILLFLFFKWNCSFICSKCFGTLPITMYCFTILPLLFIYITLVCANILCRRGVGEVSQRSRVLFRQALWTWRRAHGELSHNSLSRIVAMKLSICFVWILWVRFLFFYIIRVSSFADPIRSHAPTFPDVHFPCLSKKGMETRMACRSVQVPFDRNQTPGMKATTVHCA